MKIDTSESVVLLRPEDTVIFGWSLLPSTQVISQPTDYFNGSTTSQKGVRI